MRWLLLGVGLLAIVGLTGMNVYTLYTLHERTISTDREIKEQRLTEFGQQIRNRFYTPFRGFSKLNMNHLDQELRKGHGFPDEFKDVLAKASADSLFEEIYFTEAELNPCESDDSMLKYHPTDGEFYESNTFPDLVCDGMGMARTRMRVLIEDYRWNNKVIFDTHRSMSVAAINLHTNSVVGYFTFVVDQQYLENDLLQPQLKKKFQSKEESGVVVWVHDWTKDNIIAASDQSVPLDVNKVQITQKFPNLFDNWNMKMMFTKNPVLATSTATLYRNLTILGAAVLILVGALVFIFVTAVREKDLATRQAEFLANVTHELKTPLSVMQAAGENLADGRVTKIDRLKSYGKHIYGEAVRLRHMIDKLLDVAKADADDIMLELKPYDLDELVKGYLDAHNTYLKDVGFDVEFEPSGDQPMVMVDADSVETIIGNLVENAVKYSTEERYLGMRVQKQRNYVYLEITDHGVGIDPKSQRYIFDKFYRGEDTLTAETRGHGLGLSIVKKVVELNNGSIRVQSQLGEGTTFIIKFPVFMGSANDQTKQTATGTGENKQTHSLKQQTQEYVG